MPYGGTDWLALTQEPMLEPALPICDPHHHFWDRRLQSMPYQRYLLDALHADISSGHNIRSTVFLEARSMYRPDGPVAMRPVGEVAFVQGLAAASASGIYGPSRAAAAIIGHADLKLGANMAPVLDALQAASPNRFRGIRHTVTWSPDPAVDNRESDGILANAAFREGAQVLSHKGLSLDVMIAFPQMPEVADFARAVPELPIILDHIGARNRVGLYANREDEVRAA
jgi:predicted TIM-barrel fold metal-dependent hydrolase